MQNFFQFLVDAAHRLEAVMFNRSLMKHVLLIFSMVSLSRAIVWENEHAASAVCDNKTMHVRVNFKDVFQGVVYQSRGYYNPKCSYMVPVGTNVMEVNLSMPFQFCDIKIEELGNRTTASTEVVIQMHSLLDSIYDKLVNFSCEILNFQSMNETDVEDSNPFEAVGLEESWIEFHNGLVLFGEVGEPIESTLYFVVYIRDDGSNKDMVVQNCIAHTDRKVTKTTNLIQLSNFFGCPDPSSKLSNFTVVHQENNFISMFAYAPVSNFSLLASGGRISISCGVTICENTCPAHCNGTDGPNRLPLSDYVTKDIITRKGGALMPDSLNTLNRHNDRSRRTLKRHKRSFTSFFARIFQWESRLMNGSISERNITNITSFGISKEIVVTNGIFLKDVLASSHKSVGVSLKNTDPSLAQDEILVDGKTRRFIYLMIICLFIAVVAYYCCYVDKSKKTMQRQTPFVFLS